LTALLPEPSLIQQQEYGDSVTSTIGLTLTQEELLDMIPTLLQVWLVVLLQES
jgi:hypothetical protein